jgi:hypothetical protein
MFVVPVGLYLSLLGFVFGGVVEYNRILLLLVVIIVVVIVVVDVVSSTRQEVVVECGSFMLTTF